VPTFVRIFYLFFPCAGAPNNLVKTTAVRFGKTVQASMGTPAANIVRLVSPFHCSGPNAVLCKSIFHNCPDVAKSGNALMQGHSVTNA
jgi:hypothetical protein